MIKACQNNLQVWITFPKAAAASCCCPASNSADWSGHIGTRDDYDWIPFWTWLLKEWPPTLQRYKVQAYRVWEFLFDLLAGLQHISRCNTGLVQDATEGHSNLSSTLILITITPGAGAASWAIVDLFPIPPPANWRRSFYNIHLIIYHRFGPLLLNCLNKLYRAAASRLSANLFLFLFLRFALPNAAAWCVYMGFIHIFNHVEFKKSTLLDANESFPDVW